MSCPTCIEIDSNTNPDLPHVVRVCKTCGSDYRVREPGAHGIGFVIQKGDRVVLPAAFLKVSANPLKTKGHLTRAGVEWFAELVFGTNLAGRNNKEDVLNALHNVQEQNEELFSKAEFLSDLDLNNPQNETGIYDRISQRTKSVEWWGYMAAALTSMASQAVAAGDAATAAWAIACAERFRALALFKQNFEEVVFMGHSASRLVQLMQISDGNRSNKDEGFWQIILKEHSCALSQLFAVQ